MIPVAWAGGFFLRYWRHAVALLLLLTVVAFIYVTGRNHERGVWKPRNEALQAQMATLRIEIAAATDLAARQRAAAEADAEASLQRVKEHYESRVHAGNAALDAALGELRRARAAGRPLAPAGAAPAPCGDYEADRTRLPQQDAEFLIREAARADEVVLRLGACRQYAADLHRICSAPEVAR